MGPEGARLKFTPFFSFREREKMNCTRLTECIKVIHEVFLLLVAFRSKHFARFGIFYCFLVIICVHILDVIGTTDDSFILKSNM